MFLILTRNNQPISDPYFKLRCDHVRLGRSQLIEVKSKNISILLYTPYWYWLLQFYLRHNRNSAYIHYVITICNYTNVWPLVVNVRTNFTCADICPSIFKLLLFHALLIIKLWWTFLPFVWPTNPCKYFFPGAKSH